MLFKSEDDPPFARQRTPGEARTGTAWHDDDPVLVAVLQDGADILFVSGKENCVGFEVGPGGIV